VRLSATNSLAEEPALFDFDAVYLTPSLHDNPQAFELCFWRLLAEYEPDLVIPCRDEDVAFLAVQAERRPEWRDRFLCGDSNVAMAMLDKAESERFSREHGLPFAPTLSATAQPEAVQAFLREQGFPLIAKPARGFASRGVELILNQDQLEQILGRSDYILQKYLGDPEPVWTYARKTICQGIPLFHTFEEVKHSVQVSIAPSGYLTGLLVTRNTMRYGRSERVELDDDDEIARAGQQWAAAFSRTGWRGPLNIQCQYSPARELMIYEYNGRLTGATAARFLLGFDEVGMILKDWIGYALPSIPSPAGVHTVIRSPVSRRMDPAKVAQLSRESYWQAAFLNEDAVHSIPLPLS
jgi:carbamoyl-phosphate synthase large subunit